MAGAVMQIGRVGLGRMGANMARRLAGDGICSVASDAAVSAAPLRSGS